MSVFKKPLRATIDAETRSTLDLEEVGGYRYLSDPTTDVLVWAFRLPHWAPGRTELWTPEYPDLGIYTQGGNFDALFELFEWLANGGLVEAHNAQFDRGVWERIMVPRYGWPSIPRQQWRCSAAQAAACALPRSLDDALRAMRLAMQKDGEGYKVMKKMTKPRKARKAEREEWREQYGDKPLPVLYHENRHLLDQLFSYVRQDVLAEEALSYVLPDLSPDELELYWLDQEMNERGYQLDMDAVDAALYLIGEEFGTLGSEFAELTDGQVERPTQRERLKIWLDLEGLSLDNTQAATIEDAMTRWEELQAAGASDKAHRALEILQVLGGAAFKKYEAMKAIANEDGRVRGGLLYHGASTGRWSGKGVQPQNFPKGTLKVPDSEDPNAFVMRLWDNIFTLDRQLLLDTYGASVMDVLTHALRSAIVAGPGKELFVADYASIEARVVLWLAGDEDALDVFRRGEDIYLYTAEGIYHRPITKADKAERQMGKQACLGADTLVLTDSGWVPIVDVTTDHLVWDGEEWTRHGGLIYNGIRDTFRFAGVSITPDHKILTSEAQWLPAPEVARSAFTLNRALATGLENLPSTAYSVENEAGCERYSSPVLVEPVLTKFTNPTCEVANQLGAITVRKQNPRPLESTIGVTQISSQIMYTENGCSIASAPSSRVARTPTVSSIATMAGGASACIAPGWSDTGVVEARTQHRGVSGFSRIWSRLTDGTTPNWNWTGSTMTKDTGPEIFGSSRGESTLATDDRSAIYNSEFLTLKPVYDLVNAGKRHRFTIWTDRGPLIVHNCLGLGYQMGAPKFVDTVAKYGITITEDFARQVVDAYRAKYWRTKELWQDQERAAIQCVKTKRSVECGKVTWHYHHEFLWCELPSGRQLAYPFAWVSMQKVPWGEKETLQFMSVNPKTRQWQATKTYGGMIVENITQAVARDLIAHSLKMLEAHPVYTPILSVHDEAIAEADEGRGEVKAFEHLMATTPDWAYGLPVAAEAWKGFRYRK